MAQSTTETTIPAGVKQPQDHRPPHTDQVTVEWEGHSYLVDREAMEDLDFISYLQDNRFKDAMPVLLGKEQWEAFRQNHRSARGRLTITRIGEFLEQVHSVAGLGNS